MDPVLGFHTVLRHVWMVVQIKSEYPYRCKVLGKSGQLAIGGWQLAVGSWRLAVGSWRLAVGNWQLAVDIISQTANCQLATENCRKEKSAGKGFFPGAKCDFTNFLCVGEDDIVDANGIVLRKNCRPFDHGFQFAYIAGPGIFAHELHGFP